MLITTRQCLDLAKGTLTKGRISRAVKTRQLKDYGETRPGGKRHHYLFEEREFKAWWNPARYGPRDLHPPTPQVFLPKAQADPNGGAPPLSKLAQRLAASVPPQAHSPHEEELLAVLKDLRTLLQSLL